MTRVVAVEWDGREVRMAVGAVSGGSVLLEHLIAQSAADDSQGESINSAKLTEIIKSLARKAGLSGGEILVAMGRSRVELRNLSLPKADTDELPDMVRFTAMRQFANIGDTWPIDFAPLPAAKQIHDDSTETGNGGLQEVLAMTVNPATISQIRKACADAGFTVTQIGLRPMASATLAAMVANSPIGADSTCLLIDVLADEADMVVLEKGHVSFMRTVQLPLLPDGTRGPLPVGEIRRTLIAAVSARPGLRLERIVLWSEAGNAKSNIEAWQPSLDLLVDAIDPISLVEAKKSVEKDIESGRFAPLIGLLLQRRLSAKSIRASTFIDFLHPRQRTEKKIPIRQYALAAVAGALLVGGGWWTYRSKHQALDAEIARLSQEYKGMESTLQLAKKNTEHWKKVERFLAGDIQWLDELSYLSTNSLPADQMVVGDLNISLNPLSNAGKITTRIGITDQTLQPEVEEKIRDPRHQIGTKSVKKSQQTNTPYRWTLEPEILVVPAAVMDPTSLPPPAKAESNDNEAAKKEEVPST